MPVDVAALVTPLVTAPYGRFLGVELVAADRGHVRLALPSRDDTSNRNGGLHGGGTASLLAIAGMAAARSGQDDDAPWTASTVDFAVHYLAGSAREGVVADGVVTRRGRALVFVEASVASATGAPLARSIAAVRVGPATAGAPLASTPCAIEPTTVLDLHRSGSAFTARLGIRSAIRAPGHAVLLLPRNAALTDADGCVHEGALASLVDSAGGAAAWSVAGFHPAGRAATIGMHLCCAHVPADDVVIEARTSWQAADLYQSSVVLTARTDGRAIAAGSVTYRITRPED